MDGQSPSRVTEFKSGMRVKETSSHVFRKPRPGPYARPTLKIGRTFPMKHEASGQLGIVLRANKSLSIYGDYKVTFNPCLVEHCSPYQIIKDVLPNYILNLKVLQYTGSPASLATVGFNRKIQRISDSEYSQRIVSLPSVAIRSILGTDQFASCRGPWNISRT